MVAAPDFAANALGALRVAGARRPDRVLQAPSRTRTRSTTTSRTCRSPSRTATRSRNLRALVCERRQDRGRSRPSSNNVTDEEYLVYTFDFTGTFGFNQQAYGQAALGRRELPVRVSTDGEDEWREATAAPRPDDADERRSLHRSAILLGVVGPEVFIVQPGFVQGHGAVPGFRRPRRRARGLGRDVRHRRDDGRDDLRRAPLQLAQGRAVRRSSSWSSTNARVHAGHRRHGVRGRCDLRRASAPGGLISLSFAAIGLTRKPDRNFGYLIMWVLTYGALRPAR